MKKSSPHSYRKYLTLGLFSLLVVSFSVYAAMQLPWGGDEKRENGFLIQRGALAKTIDLTSSYGAGNCKVVSSANLSIFVPTGNANDWNAFKSNANRNVGAVINDCVVVPSCNNNGIKDNGETGLDCAGGGCGPCNCGDGFVEGAEVCDDGFRNGQPNYCNATCSGPTRTNGNCNIFTPGYCSGGNITNDNGLTTPGTTRTWLCTGIAGGTTASCNYTNPGVAVNGKCDNTNYGACTTGTRVWINNTTSCNTTATWRCTGVSGGSDDPQTCSKANIPCGPSPIDGGWSPWGACISGSQSRTCTNPAPANGGANCIGSPTQSCGSTPPASIFTIDSPVACIYAAPNTYYKINFWTQTNTPPGYINETIYTVVEIGGQAAFKGYSGTNGRWAQPVGYPSPPLAYATSSCIPTSGSCGSSLLSCNSPSIAINDNGNTNPGQNRTWTCPGSGGGSDATGCSYTNPVASCTPPSSWSTCSGTCGGGAGNQSGINSCGNTVSQSCTNNNACASCGGAQGSRSTNPLTDGSTNLCSVGSASNGAHTANPSWIVGTYARWDCTSGASVVSCRADSNVAAPVNGACGSAGGQLSGSNPLTTGGNLCAAGTAAGGASDHMTGTATWQCDGSNGGTNKSCSAKYSVTGWCSAAEGQTYSILPAQLCYRGAIVSGPDERLEGLGEGNYKVLGWDWSCGGLNGGSSISCSATYASVGDGGGAGGCGGAGGSCGGE